ncbi:MAG: tRNA 5-methoxyuridine(34)/uridine 5-oxyacetic acid(34) synthase CmoB [Epsilonproteobacteria bacterium]|nr:tRNA 5-methoxyuridine(34)/uridine 5-oxyacetic acid(34) synthase CmoB [Campylobacterota bacterium]
MNRFEEVKKEYQKRLEWKHISPLQQKVKALEKIECEVELGDVIKVKADKAPINLKEIAYDLRPWRKGPFDLFGLFIDSEWRSYLKYNLLEPFFNLKGKVVADVGCNNGYYMFRMLRQDPKEVVGFDPSPLFKTQFDLINHFIQANNLFFELLGVEHLPLYPKKFDTIFCLGVLYHRSDPITTLKQLKQGLKKGGELFLDTFFIEGEEPIALTPLKTYSKIPNIYFIPTPKALEHWCYRAGFRSFEILAKKVTTTFEQRKTNWILGESLEQFLDPNDPTKTIEGYPAPQRLYVRVTL